MSESRFLVRLSVLGGFVISVFAFQCSSGGAPSAGATDGGAEASPEVPEAHRAAATTCGPGAAQPEPDASQVTGGVANNCKKNEDCTAGKNGACVPDLEQGAHCLYDECATDADCKGGVCACGANHGVRNECIAGDCKVDADCGTGYCSPTVTCGVFVSFHCHHPGDACVNDADCQPADASPNGKQCAFATAWACAVEACPL